MNTGDHFSTVKNGGQVVIDQILYKLWAVVVSGKNDDSDTNDENNKDDPLGLTGSPP